MNIFNNNKNVVEISKKHGQWETYWKYVDQKGEEKIKT